MMNDRPLILGSDHTDFKTKKVRQEVQVNKKCHSAEILPDGAIVSANSGSNKIIGTVSLHREGRSSEITVPDAHGVVWDAKRGTLWINGDKLYLAAYEKDRLVIAEQFELPAGGSGHDLFPTRDSDSLLVSDHGGLYEFDCATKEFALILKRRFIKSASQHIDGTIWMTDTTNVEGYKDFQTDTLTRVRPAEPPLSYTKKGARFYKARWYYRNAFSYGRENPSD